MKKVSVLVDSFADEGLTNAQMSNAREIIRRLDLERFEISVFCVGKPDQQIVNRANVRIIPLPKRKQTLSILREFLAGKHEILFYMKSSPASRIYTQLRKRWRDSRITIGTVESQSNLGDEPTISARAVSLWERTVLACDYLFSNSISVRNSLKREYGLKSEIVPTGVDASFFRPPARRTAGSRPVVLFVGSLRSFKGPHTVLDAARRFPQADFRIVGSGVIADELKERRQRERIGNVTFLGALDALQVREQYQSADVFLFPSRWEGSPKVLLEAGACGLPVLARSDYSPESVIDGRTGYLAASDQELLIRLEQLLACPNLRNHFGRAGRHHSLSFDWSLITRKWEEVFLSLAPSVNVRRTA